MPPLCGYNSFKSIILLTQVPLCDTCVFDHPAAAGDILNLWAARRYGMEV